MILFHFHRVWSRSSYLKNKYAHSWGRGICWRDIISQTAEKVQFALCCAGFSKTLGEAHYFCLLNFSTQLVIIIRSIQVYYFLKRKRSKPPCCKQTCGQQKKQISYDDDGRKRICRNTEGKAYLGKGRAL